MGNFQKSKMLYKDYLWKSEADKDDPYYTEGRDHSELNRREGYEVLYFINHFGEKHFAQTPHLSAYQKIERMIRKNVPAGIKTHRRIARWIMVNWDHY